MSVSYQPDARPRGALGRDGVGRLGGGGRVAIIDIGSNSVRLVVYDHHARSPTPYFNEKVLCGLGRGVATTRLLPADAVERALAALGRFRILLDTMRVGWTRVLATAAARDALNGPAFLEAARRACGQEVELLTGEREAALSAAGVVSGFLQPDGLVGDLGGGSLELVDVAGKRVGTGMTLPLGGLVLRDRAGGSPREARRIVREELAGIDLFQFLGGRTFYAVGGTWRALAKLEMTERAYPLRVMHGYDVQSPERLIRLAETASDKALKTVDDISEARRPLLVYGALVLEEIVRLGRPARVTISASGVRDGLLYEELDPPEKEADPLMQAAAELNDLRARSPRHGEDLIGWTDRAMATIAPDETAEERRLRRAACLLSDIGWRAHPDYRGDQSLAMIAQASFLGIDHPGRAYLALTVFLRHAGLSLDRIEPSLAAIATPRLLALARLLAALFRVAYQVSAGTGGILPDTPLVTRPDGLVLSLPGPLAPLASERLLQRLKQLGKVLDMNAFVEIG